MEVFLNIILVLDIVIHGIWYTRMMEPCCSNWQSSYINHIEKKPQKMWNAEKYMPISAHRFKEKCGKVCFLQISKIHKDNYITKYIKKEINYSVWTVIPIMLYY